MYTSSVEEVTETYVQIDPSHLDQHQGQYILNVQEEMPMEQYAEEAKPTNTSYTTLETPTQYTNAFNDSYSNNTVQQFGILQGASSRGGTPPNEGVLYRDCTLSGTYVPVPSNAAQDLLYRNHEAYQAQANSSQIATLYGSTNGNFQSYITNGNLELNSGFSTNSGLNSEMAIGGFFPGPSTSNQHWSQMDFEGKYQI